MYYLKDNDVFCAVLGHVNSNDVIVTFNGDDANTMVDDVCDHNNIFFEPSDDESDIGALIMDVKKFFFVCQIPNFFWYDIQNHNTQ